MGGIALPNVPIQTLYGACACSLDRASNGLEPAERGLGKNTPVTYLHWLGGSPEPSPWHLP